MPPSDSTLTTAENDLNLVADVAAVAVPGAGALADAALQGAEAVTNTVADDLATHQSALSTAAAAVSAVATASAPVIATLPAAAQANATGILASISSLLAEFAEIF